MHPIDGFRWAEVGLVFLAFLAVSFATNFGQDHLIPITLTTAFYAFNRLIALYCAQEGRQHQERVEQLLETIAK